MSKKIGHFLIICHKCAVSEKTRKKERERERERERCELKTGRKESSFWGWNKQVQ